LKESAHAPGASDTPSCYACHRSGHAVERTGTGLSAPAYAPAVCTSCHGEVVEVFLGSDHGSASAEGNADAPGCFYCHGKPHDIKTVEENATLAPAELSTLCGECHKGKEHTSEAPFTIPDPVSQLRAGVHGEINEKTGNRNAGCTDCHGAHNELPSWAPGSSTNFMNVAATCGRCHEEERELFSISVHGLAAAAGLKDSPVCTDCHGDHNVMAVADLGPYGDKRTRTVAICSSCHYALALSTKFGIPNDRVPTFEESYHGVVSEGGKATAADCGSCHRVHDVLPSSDPRSSVHPSNLEETCGSCHLGASERFINTRVHDPETRLRLSPADVVAYLYIALIIIIVGAMASHNILDYIGKIRDVRKEQLKRSRALSRLSLGERVQHIFLLSTFSLLAFTGFSIKYPSAWFFSWLVHLEGPYPVRTTIHKALGVVLIVVSVYHVGYLVLTKAGRRRLKAIAPRFKDVRDTFRSVLNKLGIVKRKPEYDEFNYAEKAEYWALVWGNIVMASTGLYMWLDPYLQEHLPFWFYSVVRAVHFYEAYLAVLAIVIWHLYHVIFDPAVYPMNFAWLDGKMTEELLIEEKLGYLRKLKKAEKDDDKPPRDELT
jgi:cytochrome b subunit of formate dehydrogenase/5-methylcytosine-specific restriction endonuclease McrA